MSVDPRLTRLKGRRCGSTATEASDWFGLKSLAKTSTTCNEHANVQLSYVYKGRDFASVARVRDVEHGRLGDPVFSLLYGEPLHVASARHVCSPGLAWNADYLRRWTILSSQSASEFVIPLL